MRQDAEWPVLNGKQVLIVRPDRAAARPLADVVRKAGYAVVTADTADKALAYAADTIDLVCSSVDLPDLRGTALLSLWKLRQPGSRFILFDDIGDVGNAKDSIRTGADDYLAWPADPADFLFCVACATKGKESPGPGIVDVADTVPIEERIIGRSIVLNDLRAKLRRAAANDSTVILLGESGTGKGLAVQVLHEKSGFPLRPLGRCYCRERSCQRPGVAR